MPTVLVGLLAGCGKQESATEDTVAEPEARATFVGSDSCTGCHGDEAKLFAGSHHDLAMQHATTDTVLGDFDDATIEYFGSTTRFFRDGEKFFVTTEDGNGEQQTYDVAYTFGVEPLQQYLVPFDNGYVQTLPFAWDTVEQRWFHVYGDEYIAADDELHWTRLPQNWNYMCAECHSTNLQKNYSLTEDTFATSWTDINVGCEACHGPGSKHVARAQLGSFDKGHGLDLDLDDRDGVTWRMNPDTGIAAREPAAMSVTKQPEACGRCHARRGVLSSDYEHGQLLLDTHLVSLLNEPMYFADGQIREEVYVYGSFLQSKMYRAGVTCGDCHDPHSSELRTGPVPSDICSTCHLTEKFASELHHGHAEGSAECVDCHMTDRNYMVVDPRRDHSFRIPRPDLSAATGSPNACNGCHDDRDTEWAVAAWTDMFGAPEPGHFAHAFHAAGTGDPSANSALLGVIADEQEAGIVRATALSLLRPPLLENELRAIDRSLQSGDPLVRMAAVRLFATVPGDQVVQRAALLLSDPVRAVRLAAFDIVSPGRTMLPPNLQSTFNSVEREFIDAQMAVAEWPDAVVNLASLFRDQGNQERAESYYSFAIGKEPALTTARGNLADLYREQGRDEDGEAVLREGLAINDEDAALHHVLGLLLVRTDRRAEAMVELERAVELEPTAARYIYVYAIALHSSGEIDDALDELRDARDRGVVDFDNGALLVTILLDRGDVAGARSAYDDLRVDYPEHPQMISLLQAIQQSERATNP